MKTTTYTRTYTRIPTATRSFTGTKNVHTCRHARKSNYLHAHARLKAHTDADTCICKRTYTDAYTRACNTYQVYIHVNARAHTTYNITQIRTYKRAQIRSYNTHTQHIKSTRILACKRRSGFHRSRRAGRRISPRIFPCQGSRHH